MPTVQHIQLSYKSIANAELTAKRVNVFIGEPNSGKSNLLEALALLSSGTSLYLQEILRARQPADLFFDHEIESEIGLTIDNSFGWTLTFEKQHGRFAAKVRLPNVAPHTSYLQSSILPGHWPNIIESPFRYYAYRRVSAQNPSQQYSHLESPYGGNLAALLYSNKELRQTVSALFRSKGFRLEVRPQESQIFLSKEVNEILYSYPFESISETLQRIVFYKAALETNRDSVLILDEPEANTFPFYTKYLAERIALDETNQFFLTTHNPYVLMSIIEKTPKQDLAVFATRMKNFRTEFHPVSEEGLTEILDLSMDVFLNLERFFPQ